MRLESELWYTIPIDPVLRRVHADCERLICWYWPPREHRRALWVAYVRSHLDPRHVPEYTGDGYGLFGLQPDDVPWSEADVSRMLNPIVNVAAAYRLWRMQGWDFFSESGTMQFPAGLELAEVPSGLN